MAKKQATTDAAPKPGGCGYVIDRGARAGERMNSDECAFTTYALLKGTTAVAVALPQPTVAFWGPGQKIPQSVGAATVKYSFVGGVVFKNC